MITPATQGDLLRLLREKYIMEEGDFRSRNYVPGRQGWRLHPTGFEDNGVADVAFTPVWGFTGTGTIGNGTIAGTYSQRGNIREDRITVVFNSTTDPGNGQWFFSLSGTSVTGSIIAGTAHFRLATGGDFLGVVIAKDTSHIYLVMTGGTAPTTGVAGNGVPAAAYTPTADYLEIFATYRTI